MLIALGTILFVLLIPNLSNAEDLSQSIVYALQTKISLIAIDPGFGGDKTGPFGCDGNVFAKNINLQIAKKVAERIKYDLGINVIFTREIDADLSLEERATIANTKEADLLISIHTNGSEHSSVSGIETFFLSLVPEPNAIRIAAMKNAKNPKNIADMESILSDLMQNTSIHESELLAKTVQKYLYQQVKKRHLTVRNRGIKKAPFYVLLGAQMPAIMIQTGFITNPAECKLLNSDEYQEDISIGIVEGIRAFMKARHTHRDRDAHR